MQKYSIIYCTCDEYIDLSDNFFHQLKKYWPEFSGDVIFNSDTKDYQNNSFNIINIKHDPKYLSWSQRLYDALKVTKTDFVLLFLDDFFLEGYVNNSEFLSCLSFLETRKDVNGIAFTLEPGVGKKLNSPLTEFSFRKHFTPYKLTAHIALYRKSFLMNILKRDENAWEFEINGTIRALFKKGKFVCKNNRNFTFPYSYGQLIRRGKYDKQLKEHFERIEGLSFPVDRPFYDENNSSECKKSKINYLIRGVLSFFSKKPHN